MGATNKHTPTPDELLRRSEQRGIRSSVAMYTIKDLWCAGKLEITDLSDFFEKVEQTYESLREISAGEASPKQKQWLIDMLRSSTFNDEEAHAMGLDIVSPFFSVKQFNDMKDNILENLLPVTDRPGNARVEDLNEELKKQGKS